MFIFDFDGVICDSFKSAILILNKLAAEFKLTAIPLSDIEELRHIETIEIFQRLGVSKEQFPSIVTRLLQELSLSITTLEPINGIKAALQKLKQHQAPLGILSSNSKENVLLFLQHHDMDCFDFIYSGSFFNKGDILKNLIASLGLTPNEVFYIGDESRDIMASREAQVNSISVTWGFNAKAVLLRHNPENIIQTPEELMHFLLAKISKNSATAI